MKTVFIPTFFVDLSHRKTVLSSGGPLQKGLGGIITYTFTPLCTAFPLAPWSILRFFLSMQKEVFLYVAVLRLAVLAQAPAVVPQVVTVVPLLGSRSTVSPGPAQHHKRK